MYIGFGYPFHLRRKAHMEEFMRFYEKVYPQMYRTAWFYLQNRQEAEDAVQDAVLMKNLASLRIRKSLGRGLCRYWLTGAGGG